MKRNILKINNIRVGSLVKFHGSDSYIGFIKNISFLNNTFVILWIGNGKLGFKNQEDKYYGGGNLGNFLDLIVY